MDKNNVMQFWSKELKIPLNQFTNPYIKNSNRRDVIHKGFGYGTCTLIVNDVLLKEKVMMSIKALADFYSKQI